MRRSKVTDTPPRARRDPREPVPDVVYLQVFDTPQGQLVLAELERIFVPSATLTGGIDAVLRTYHGNGQRSVIEHIVRKINRANGVPEE